MIMASSCLGMLLSFICLLLSMKRQYRRTFYSTKTSNEAVRENFTNFEDDEVKINILSQNKYKVRVP